MTTPELLPCPFCGGEADIWRAHEGRTAWIACMGKCVVLISKEYLSDDEAITAWNRRADLAAVQPAQVRVKPLVWEEPCYTNNWIHVARSVLGDYYISIDGGRHSAWLEANVKPYENKIGDDVGSAIEAMMMAETDYQARMQPLITPQPDPRDDVIARLTDMTANMDAMRNFIADFAAFKFDACYQNHASRPEDDGDDVTDAEPVWSWQEDARALIAQKATP